jgi:DNA-binding MarR family transcriptional regulator
MLGERIIDLSDQLSDLIGRGESGPTDEPGQRSLSVIVERMIETRRKRGLLFSPLLFSDPAWDILLYLLQAELRDSRISFTTLADRANIPPTTAIRWATVLIDRGILVRRDDPKDARRSFIELHPDASAALRELLESLAEGLLA